MVFKYFIALLNIICLAFVTSANTAGAAVFSRENNKNNAINNFSAAYTGKNAASSQKLKCIVIDPGHGGKHPGAISKVGGFREKDITLSVALKLGSLINQYYPDIKVIYTRTKDVYVDLDVRAAIANKAKADLFLSIHCNSATSTAAYGTETFVMGASKSAGNFEVCKRENAVITVEDDYKTKYENFNPDSPESYIIFSLLQNTHLEQSLIFASHIQNKFAKGPIKYNRGVKQGGLLVLWKTTMPAVLTEIGFLSNAKDRAVLSNKTKQQEIAKCLFDAFKQYKTEYEEGTLSSEPVPQPDIEPDDTQEQQESAIPQVQEPAPAKVESNKSAWFWGVQVMSVNKKLNCSAELFKGVEVKRYRVGNTYKYIYGNFEKKEDALNALPAVRKKFPEAFLTRGQYSQTDK